MEIVFDVNVPPDALFTKDYEELYQDKKNKEGGIKDLVDSEEHQKRYFYIIKERYYPRMKNCPII